MISKGMDIKELVNSDLLFPPVWTKYTLFSEMQESSVCIYNNELEDLEYEDPFMLFDKDKDSKLSQ